jgi:hypothetical protein
MSFAMSVFGLPSVVVDGPARAGRKSSALTPGRKSGAEIRAIEYQVNLFTCIKISWVRNFKVRGMVLGLSSRGGWSVPASARTSAIEPGCRVMTDGPPQISGAARLPADPN